MKRDPLKSGLMRRTITGLALALMLATIWIGPACAFICAGPGTSAEGSGHCHEESSTQHPGASSDDHGCSKDACARLQPAFQTSRPAEVATPQYEPLFAFFPAASQGIHASLNLTNRRKPLLDIGLGPPVPPSTFTILRA